MRGILGRAGKTSWKEELRTAGVFFQKSVNYKVIHRRGARSTCRRSSSMSSDLDMLVVSTPRNSKYFTRLLVESRDTTCLLSLLSFLKNCTASMGLVSARSRSAQGLPERDLDLLRAGAAGLPERDLDLLRAAAAGLFNCRRSLRCSCLRRYSSVRSLNRDRRLFAAF